MKTLVALAVALAASACGSRGPSSAPSVLLVTLDTTRADALGCYGNPAQITPNLDALAREGVLFANARTVAPLTLPAHASMMTGLYPPRHGIADNGFCPLPRAAVTVAEVAREAGVETAAFVAAVVLDPSFGLAQGFELYDAPPRGGAHAGHRITDRPATEVVDRALAWFEARDRSRPFFVWVHVFDAHAPYTPAPEMRERAKGSAYLGEVAAVDDALGRLFTQLREHGELAHASVIVVGDHGESLGQHGEATHGTFVYDATLRVPLIVRRADGARAGERSEAIVSVVDVAPTALGALGLAAPPELDGLDLAEPVPADRGAYFESYEAHLGFDASPLAGWVDSAAKYVHSTQPELYDPNTDARERRNRIAEHDGDVARYRAAIAAVWERTPLAGDGERTIDARLRDQLRELGYSGLEAPVSRLPNPLAPSDRKSPAELSGVIQRFWEATDQAYAGNYDAAIDVMAELAARQPRSALIATTLADYLIQREQFAQAEPFLRRLIDSGQAHASTFNALGWCRERAGDVEGAARNYARALELDPGHPNARENFERVRASAKQ